MKEEKPVDTSNEHERLFWDLMRECRDSPPGARISVRVRFHLERLLPDERRELVARKVGGCAPLFVAARRGLAEVVEYLVSVCDADMEQRGAYAAETGDVPHSVTPLWAAAVAGRLESLRVLIDAGADCNAPSDSGSTPVRSACFMTHFECVRLLAERGADLSRPNHHGSTCLVNAVQSPQLCSYLLECGVAVNTVDAQGKTALHYAVQEHRTDTVIVLLAAGADPRLTSRSGDDALRTAAVRGDPATLKVIAAAVEWEPSRLADAHELLGATQYDELNDASVALATWRHATLLRQTPSGYVAKRPVRAPAPALNGAVEWTTMEDLDALDGNVDGLRMQALLVVVRVLGPYHKDTLIRLMYRGAAYADSMRYGRAVALWLWAFEIRVAHNTLLAPGASQTIAALTRLVTETGASGGPGCAARAARSALDVLTVVMPAMASARELLEARPRCRLQALALETALRCSLHLIAAALNGGEEEGATEAARMLVASGARSIGGDTPLHLAAGELPPVRSTYFAGARGKFPRTAVVRLLLAVGAPVDVLNAAGCTPLHLATRVPTEGLADALVKAGAHLDRPDGRYGATAARRLASWRSNTVCIVQHVSLACRAAAAVVAAGITPPPGMLPATLDTFLAMHRPPPPWNPNEWLD